MLCQRFKGPSESMKVKTKSNMEKKESNKIKLTGATWL